MSSANGMGFTTVVPKTADFTIVKDTDQNKCFTNEGAAGTITAQLPAATVGQRYRFKLKVAQQFRLEPNGTDGIALPSTGAAGVAGKYIVADAVGEGVELECVKDGSWDANFYIGTWTAEA